jgi:hypothetical protein
MVAVMVVAAMVVAANRRKVGLDWSLSITDGMGRVIYEWKYGRKEGRKG